MADQALDEMLEEELSAAKRRMKRLLRECGTDGASEAAREAERKLRSLRQGIFNAEDSLAVVLDPHRPLDQREAAAQTIAGLGFRKTASAALEHIKGAQPGIDWAALAA